MVRENKIPTRDKRRARAPSDYKHWRGCAAEKSGKRPIILNMKETKFYKFTIEGVPIKNNITDISLFLKQHAQSRLHQHAVKLVENNVLQSNDAHPGCCMTHPGSCNRNDYVCMEEDDTPLDAMILKKSEFKSEDVIELAYKQEPL